MSNEPDVDFSGPGMLTPLNYNVPNQFCNDTCHVQTFVCSSHSVHALAIEFPCFLFLQLILITSTSSEQLGRVLLGR